MRCRNCGAAAETVFCDLGVQPPSNAYLSPEDLDKPEVFYPLRPVICPECLLVQLPALIDPEEIFREYAYFSSQSSAFVEHARQFVEQVVPRFLGIPREPLVVEIASNDGYLLQHFTQRGIRCYGIEPARAQAEAAIRNGVPTLIEFFDANLVLDRLVDTDGDWVTGGRADLIVANNVLAHVPDLHGFLQGIRLLLAPEGVLTIEVPWLKDLIEDSQLGQIYHEHLSYFLLSAIERALGATAAPLRVFDVEVLPKIHGGSLRVFACHEAARHKQERWVEKVRDTEAKWLASDPLITFAGQVASTKRAALRSLAEIGPVVGYGAPAKANTLINYLGLGTETIPYVVDSTPAKQGTFLPGSRIPVLAPEVLSERKPETILIMAPNWATEMREKITRDCDWDPTVLCEPWRAMLTKSAGPGTGGPETGTTHPDSLART